MTSAASSLLGITSVDVEEEEDPQFEYGCGRCRPRWLQWCTNPKALLMWICWFACVQGFLINGINNVNVSTLERRYNLPSSQVGFISSAYDLSAGIFILLVTYIGAHAHQPRMLAIGALSLTVGAFIMTLPQFTVGPYQLGERPPDSCDIYDNGTNCDEERTYLTNYLYLFILGMLINGFGGTILFSLGIVLVDSNVSSKNNPLYQGIFYAFSSLGPAIGYIGGGQILNIYVDFYRVKEGGIDIGTDDPRWVGAWWIGYSTGGLLCLTVFIGLVMYPRELPTTEKIRHERKSEAHQDGSEEVANKKEFGRSIRDLPIALKLLLCNPTNMLGTLGSVGDILVVNGFATFLPKFIQTQYGQTASAAALLGGVLVVPGAAGGELMGGVVSRFLKLKVKGMLRMCSLLNLIVSTLAILLVVLSCDSPPLAGVNVAYFNRSIERTELASNLSHACNDFCHCTTISYEPICGVDGSQYFSPCYAGCLSYHGEGTSKTFGNCSCIVPPASSNLTYMDIKAEPGNCAKSCGMLPIFIPCFFIMMVCTFMVQVPAVCAGLRYIPHNQRAFGLGVRFVFIRFLGAVPGPILFGAIFDHACIVWQDKCDERGSCWIYDRSLLATYLVILIIVVKLISTLSYFLASLCYKPPKDEKHEMVVKPEDGDINNKEALDGNVQSEEST